MDAERKENGATDDDIKEGLPFDVEGDILDNNSGGDNLIIVSLYRGGGGIDLRCRR